MKMHRLGLNLAFISVNAIRMSWKQRMSGGLTSYQLCVWLQKLILSPLLHWNEWGLKEVITLHLINKDSNKAGIKQNLRPKKVSDFADLNPSFTYSIKVWTRNYLIFLISEAVWISDQSHLSGTSLNKKYLSNQMRGVHAGLAKSHLIPRKPHDLRCT